MLTAKHKENSNGRRRGQKSICYTQLPSYINIVIFNNQVGLTI